MGGELPFAAFKTNDRNGAEGGLAAFRKQPGYRDQLRAIRLGRHCYLINVSG